jgi:hypothetical protein
MLSFNQDRLTQVEQEKMHSDDRILVLKIKEGEKAVSSTGLIDHRLFKGGNTLHAMRDPNTSLWYLRYNDGVLPQPLKQQFTSIHKLLNHVKSYFSNRNIEITEIKDNYAAE